MTEQIRTVSRERLVDETGSVDETCLAKIRLWISDFLALPPP